MHYLNKPVVAICLAVVAAVAHAEEAAFDFNIPAQPVSQVLSALAKQTGLQPFYTEDSVKGIQSAGVKGRYSLHEAVGKALAGTGLTFQFTAEKAVAIKVAPAEKVAELAAIEVKGETSVPYTAKRSFAGTKMDTPLLETPMAIQVIPREVIEDRQSQSSLDAVKNASGVQAAPGTVYDQFMIRGFTTGGAGTAYRNGLALRGAIGQVDMAFVDRIEVIKGPVSTLYGRAEPGGFVNVVTKKPQEDSHVSVQQQFGSWGLARTTADATGSLNEDKTILYRVIGAYDKADSWVDFVHRENKALAAYFTFKPSSRFDANLSIEQYDNKLSHPRAGSIPVIGSRPVDLPRHFSVSDPVVWKNYPYPVDRTLIGFDWTYALNDSWKITQRFHYNRSNEKYASLDPGNFNGTDTITTRTFYTNDTDRDTINTNLEIVGEFRTGEIGHKLLLGLDWFKYEDHWRGGTHTLAANPLNIYAPTYGNIDANMLHGLVNASANIDMYRLNDQGTGFYVQDQISILDKWEILLGGRISKAKTYSTQGCWPVCTGVPLTESAPKADEFSPRAGLLYKISKDVSVYGSYSKSFGSGNGFSASGDPYPVQEGIQYELGGKASLLNDRVTTSVTLFDLTLRNRLTPDPVNPLLSIAAGEVRSRGLEFDIAGQVSKHISLVGSYTYDDAIVTKDNRTGVNAIKGKQWAGVPLHSANVWMKYDTAPGSIEGWTFGAGAYLNGQRQGNNTNTWQMPGYGRVDTMLAYRTKAGGTPLTAQLNINNLFDKKYFESSNGSTYAYYGAPRTVIGTIKVDF